MTKKRPPPHNGKIKNTRITLIFLQKKGEATMKSIEEQYTDARTKQLADKSNAELIKMVASLELELLDYADRVLSDKPIPMDSETAHVTLELIGKEAVDLLKGLDVEKEYDVVSDYA